jgi:SsrA-binding protein
VQERFRAATLFRTVSGGSGRYLPAGFQFAPRTYMLDTMARPTPVAFDKKKIVAENRRARFDYHIEDVYEAGRADRHGSEIAALRRGIDRRELCRGQRRRGLADQFQRARISHGNRFNHEPKRPRKLLLKEREISKFHGAVERKGMTLVPLSVYFNGQGRAKVELALAKGKNAADKRTTIKERDWKREKARIMKEHG